VSIGSGVLLPGVVEIPPFPILRPLAYTTGLGYRPTCDLLLWLLYVVGGKLCSQDTLHVFRPSKSDAVFSV